MIIGLLVMPMVVNHLGARLYGVWVIVGTITGYFGFLDMGLSKAVMRFVSQSLGNNDQERADDWICIALVCFVVLASVGCILSVAVWFLAPRFLSQPDDIRIIPAALFFSLLAFSLTLPTRCFQGVIEAHIRKDIISTISIIIGVLRSGFIVMAILHQGSLVTLVLISVFFAVINSVLVVFAARYIHGPFHFRRSALQFDKIKPFLGYAISTFISQVMDIIRYKSYPMIITPFLGLAALTPFAIAERLTNIIIGVCNGVLLNLTPAFSQFEGQGGVTGNEKLQRSYFYSYKISCYLGTFCVGMTLILSRYFIERWMGPQYLVAVPVLHILLCGVFFSLIQIPTLCMLFATSRQKFYAVSNSAHALITIGLCLLLVVPYKLTGIAMGIAIVTVFIKIVVQPYGVLPLLEIGLIRYHLRYTLPNVIIPMLFMAGYYYMTKSFCQPTYARIFSIAAMGSFFFVPYIFVCGFNRSERRQLLGVLFPIVVNKVGSFTI